MSTSYISINTMQVGTYCTITIVMATKQSLLGICGAEEHVFRYINTYVHTCTNELL